jgi:NAD(P)H-dependent FMN reductase
MTGQMNRANRTTALRRLGDSAEIRPTSLVGVSTTLKPGLGQQGRSAARSLLCHALEAVAALTDDVFLLDLREHALPMFDGRLPEAYVDQSVRLVATALQRAGALFISVPAYWAGVSGVFKNFVDVLGGPAYDLPPPHSTIFSGKLVGLLVVGADDASSVAGARQAIEIMGSTGAVVVNDPIVVSNLRAGHVDLPALEGQLIALAAELAQRAADASGADVR